MATLAQGKPEHITNPSGDLQANHEKLLRIENRTITD